MSARGTHRLNRALDRATYDATEAQDALSAELAADGSGDFAQHFQCPVTGKVGNKPTWNEIKVTFPHPYYMRVDPNRQNGNLSNPHMLTGIELLTDEHVMLDVQVKEWKVDSRSIITGARVRVIAWSPIAPKKQTFNAVVHMTFIGYGGPSIDEGSD
jgi:hypothetical protein